MVFSRYLSPHYELIDVIITHPIEVVKSSAEVPRPWVGNALTPNEGDM